MPAAWCFFQYFNFGIPCSAVFAIILCHDKRILAKCLMLFFVSRKVMRSHLTPLPECHITARESDVLFRFRLDDAGTSGWSGKRWCWPSSRSICRCIPGLHRPRRERVCLCRLHQGDASMWCWSRIGRLRMIIRSICSRTSP